MDAETLALWKAVDAGKIRDEQSVRRIRRDALKEAIADSRRLSEESAEKLKEAEAVLASLEAAESSLEHDDPPQSDESGHPGSP